MAGQTHITPSIPTTITRPSFGIHENQLMFFQFKNLSLLRTHCSSRLSINCSENQGHTQGQALRTCKNCKTQFDPSINHPRACRYHTAHFGGETKRKFESVYSGGTMNTADSGKVFQYWHCCGSEDPFDSGCTAAPHVSYDD